MGTTSVRRNLFNSNLSKRAVPSVPPMQGASNNTFNLQSSSHPSSSETNPSSSNNTRPADSDEIVVKDKNGSYKLDIPVLPVIVGEDGEEIEGFDEGHNGGRPGSAVNSTGETELGGREKESMLLDGSTSLLFYAKAYDGMTDMAPVRD